MYKVMESFICRGCSNPVTGTCHISVDIGAIANLELVDKLCPLLRWHVECGWRYWCSCGIQIGWNKLQ